MSADDDLKKVLKVIERSEGIEVNLTSALAGGSINSVYLIHTNSEKRVLKINEATRFPGMFEAEKQGLLALKKSNTFQIPEVITTGEAGKLSFLLLEYIPEGSMAKNFSETFSSKLAALHKQTSEQFGFPHHNYIGSLPQYNNRTTTAAEFYITQRLEPQLKIASEHGFKLPAFDAALRNIAAAIPQEPPSLIHGDLWSGNFLVNSKGSPCLIDPAVCFAPREMDLAMMKLFEGFSEEVFDRYAELYPLQQDFPQRIPLWQLYYLLVHLNIFGKSYLAPVESILKNYS